MAVPAHDERDFEFAKKYDLPIIKTICSPEEYKKYEEAEESDVEIFEEIEDKLSN
jgi:hypothetical protein